MSMYWIYDIPNWSLAALTIGSFLVGSLIGLFATRPFVRRLVGASSKHNDVVSWFFAGIGVFYGLALGLIAVATWEDYSAVDELVSKEAALLASLYRDFDGYPQPLRSTLERELKAYTRLIVDREWPAHREGNVPEEGTLKLDAIEDQVMAFDPKTEREKIAHAEVLHALDRVVEQRRLRLESVSTALPASLWAVVLAGAFLNIAITYLFWVENVALHAILVGLLAVFIALLIFLTAAMDNPFRGEFSVSSDVFEVILTNVMKGSP